MLFLKHLPRNHYYFIKGLESECAWFKEEYDTVRKSMNYVADTLMEMIAFAGLQLESIVGEVMDSNICLNRRITRQHFISSKATL